MLQKINNLQRKKKQFMYWLTTLDHDEDWFVIAKTSTSARNFFELGMGYDRYDAKTEKLGILIPEEDYEKLPYYPDMDQLKRYGFDIVSDGRPGIVRKNGRIFKEGNVIHHVFFNSSNEKGVGVYIIRVMGTQKFKIGIASNLKDRLKSLQTGSSEQLEPYYFYPTLKYKELERFLHNKFKHKSIGREWFEFNDREIEVIHDIAINFKE